MGLQTTLYQGIQAFDINSVGANLERQTITKSCVNYNWDNLPTLTIKRRKLKFPISCSQPYVPFLYYSTVHL